MLDSLQNTAVVLFVIAFSLTLLFVLRRVWPLERRTGHNEIIGWQLSILGTTYAVIVGFMLYAVWNNFQIAAINSEHEANALVNLFRFAEVLNPADRDRIQGLAINYTRVMIDDEWPAMNRGGLSQAGRMVTEELWTTLTTRQPNNPLETAAVEHALQELTEMTRYRRERQLESQATLPGILWLVLITGGLITIGAACLFGAPNVRLHTLLVLALSLLISLILVAIADIDRPFQGSVHVNPTALINAQQTFRGLATHRAGPAANR